MLGCYLRLFLCHLKSRVNAAFLCLKLVTEVFKGIGYSDSDPPGEKEAMLQVGRVEVITSVKPCKGEGEEH